MIVEASENLSWYQRLRQFFVEVWSELQKTTWPTQREVRGTTIVVILATLFFAVYLFAVDMVLQTGMDKLLRVFGR